MKKEQNGDESKSQEVK